MHTATPPSSRFQVLEVAVQAVETLRPVVMRIRQCDRDLGEQIRRALSSVALNIGEGNRSEGGNRLSRFSTAAGSNAEVRAALRVAIAWGYVGISAHAGDASPRLLASRATHLTGSVDGNDGSAVHSS